MSEIAIIGNDEEIEEEDKVQFRLLYEGRLESSGNKRRMGPKKHAIRQVLHFQLKRLWHTNKSLQMLALNQEIPSRKWHELRTQIFGSKYNEPGITDDQRFEIALHYMAHNWERLGCNFLPLITGRIALRCRLNILLLRPNEGKYIFERGDIDGQLKTLIDALKMPETNEDIGRTEEVIEAEYNPFYCLLADDKLITDVHVTTDELLLLPHEREMNAVDAFAVIDVQINHVDSLMHIRHFD